MLVDSGSSHNFLDYTIAKRLSCELQVIEGLQVTVANGDVVMTQDVCKGLKWELQGLTLQTDFYMLPLQGCDIVLGAQWLKTLGQIVWDFRSLTMQFVFNESKVKLQGLKGGSIMLATKKQLSKMNYTNGKSLFFNADRIFSFTVRQNT